MCVVNSLLTQYKIRKFRIVNQSTELGQIKSRVHPRSAELVLPICTTPTRIVTPIAAKAVNRRHGYVFVNYFLLVLLRISAGMHDRSQISFPPPRATNERGRCKGKISYKILRHRGEKRERRVVILRDAATLDRREKTNLCKKTRINSFQPPAPRSRPGELPRLPGFFKSSASKAKMLRPIVSMISARLLFRIRRIVPVVGFQTKYDSSSSSPWVPPIK